MHDIFRYATKLTRDIFEGKANPSRNMHNRKPFRTKSQKAEARATARKCADGAYRSSALRSYHDAPRASSPKA
ncbi:hypothetical protein M2336_001697 [Sphingobium sp. B1D7B]|uniref:hypothetical protein n=1 Tax=Sphingobium sp. B1D7B TaxID=2940578 RepID=UPI00222531F6|nr:hypothetical protein [Sphingobium sp. B1D7B]MCW2405068.1 hypothetical protein [Sphingobium sp. B1D7B]